MTASQEQTVVVMLARTYGLAQLDLRGVIPWLKASCMASKDFD
jgi:hypothetical protein